MSQWPKDERSVPARGPSLGDYQANQAERAIRMKPATPFNPAVLVVAVFVIAAALISFGNRRQRPILWSAFSMAAIMLLFPPWLGEEVVWVKAEPHYVHTVVSMGYAPVWSPPKRTSANTYRPMRMNWSRLLTQIGVVFAVAGGLTWAQRKKRVPLRPEDDLEQSPG